MKLSHKNLKKISIRNKISITNKNKNLAIKLFKFIAFVRKIETSLEENYHPHDKMKCPIHFCHGQECVPASLSLLLKKEDYLFSHHRSHGYYLAKKCPANKLFSELYGKETGANGGYAGSQDISYNKNNFYSGAILSGSVGISVGTALAFKLNKKKNIVTSVFGEAATDQGLFWESINYAALENLPLLLICENNNLSVITPQNERQTGLSISQKVKAFGMKSDQVFGNDPIKVYDKIKSAIFYIKKFKKPFLLEAFTYRAISHVGPMSDDTSNMSTSKEYHFWTKNNPYDNFKKILFDKKILSIKKIDQLEQKINTHIKNCFLYAEKSKFSNEKNFLKKNYNLNENKYLKKIRIFNNTKLSLKYKILQSKGY
jgi:pyruvate dehydrogenase E1 component alpha subunit